MRKIHLLMIIVALFIVCSSITIASPITFSGFVQEDCTVSPEVNITFYEQGFVNDPGRIEFTTIAPSFADGSYGTVVQPPNIVASTSYDITINVSNTACSLGGKGSTEIINYNVGPHPTDPKDIIRNITLHAPFDNSAPSNNTNIGDNETDFSWTNDYPGVNFTLEIDNTDETFSNIIRIIPDLTSTNYELLPAEELTNGQYYWRVRAINSSGTTIDTTEWSTFTLTAGAPIISNPTPANDSWTGSSPVTVTIDTDADATCKYATTSGVGYAAKTSFTTTGGTTHQTTIALANENNNTLFYQCNGTISGTISQDYEHIINLDTTPPSPAGATVLIENGNTTSLDTTLDFTWSGFTDTGSGIVNYYYSFTNDAGTTLGTFSIASPGQLTGANEGTTMVYVWAEDAVGNIGAAESDTIVVDSNPPSYEFWNHTDLTKYYSGDFTIQTVIDDTSNLQGHPQIRYRIGNDTWSSYDSMTQIAVGATWTYEYVITEQSPPNTWFQRSGENLTYEVVATDTNGFANNITRSEYINEQSTAPIFYPVSDKTVYEDNTTTFNLSGYDQDFNVLTYNCNLSGATITRLNNTVSRVRWTPTNDDVGTNLYRCNVTDGSSTITETFAITVINTNDAPVLQPIGDLYAQEYTFFNYTLNGSDVDGDTLVYGSNASFFSVNSITGKIGFTPFSTHRGDYLINVTVKDGQGGIANEELTFTVGYCGDNVCREEYESCSSCEADCGICGEKEKKALIIPARNCLGNSMSIEAVTLVPRASCEEQGVIIDDMEVCGNESNANLNVLLRIEEDLWEEVAQVVTDSNGFVSFVPEEVGNYKLQYGSDQDVYELFEVKQCYVDDADEESTAKKPSGDKGKEIVPPVVEEPTVIDDQKSKWSFFSVFLYFIIIPILLVALVMSSLGYVYRYEQKKNKESSFVKQMDVWKQEYEKHKKVVVDWMHKTTPFKELLEQVSLARKEVKKAWKFTKGLTIEYWFTFIVAIGLQRKINLEYFPLNVGSKRFHLLLVSLLKNLFPEKKPDELLGLTYQYSVKSLFDMAALLLSFKVKTTYVDPQPANIQYLNALISKGLVFRSRPSTRVDFESALQQGRPVVCLVNELGQHNSVVQSAVVLYAFDKTYFYYHDYLHDRQGLKATKDQFMHAWKAAGNKALFMNK